MSNQPLQKKEITGNLFGVKFVQSDFATPEDQKISFTIMMEDDGQWYETKISKIDSYWLDDMIETLTKARKYLKKNAKLVNGTFVGQVL